MQRIILIAFWVLIHLYGNSQTITLKGKIIDSKTSEALPYTNISVLNHAIGTSSGEKGNFNFNLPDSLLNDTLVFSYLGYEYYRTSIKKNNELIIRLKPKTIHLNEVVIKPSNKRQKKLVIEKFQKRETFVRYSPIDPKDSLTLCIPHRAKEPTIEAAYFPFSEKYISINTIKEIRVGLTNWRENSICRLRIFDSNGERLPANDLLTSPLYITNTKTGSKIMKINMEKYGIIFPKEGLFIGIETLSIPQNKFEIKAGNKSATLFSPFLEFWCTSEENYKYFIYAEGKWATDFKISKSRKTKKYYKPAISIILTD